MALPVGGVCRRVVGREGFVVRSGVVGRLVPLGVGNLLAPVDVGLCVGRN